MEPTKIGEAYDQITHLWESDKFNRENGITQHKRAISFVQHKGKALDVGCGCTGRFIDLLLDQGFTPEGVDISARMIELARARHQGQKEKVRGGNRRLLGHHLGGYRTGKWFADRVVRLTRRKLV